MLFLKIRPKAIAIILSFLWSIILIGCPSARASSAHINQDIIGVKIYQDPGNHQELFATWKKLGINTTFIGLDLACQDHFLQEVWVAGFRTFVVLPVFFNPEKVKNSPGLYAITGEGRPARDDWVKFVCPGNRLYRQEIIDRARKLVVDLKPDGLSLDFIRHFVFWEKVYPGSSLDLIRTSCFCPDCLKSFQ